MWAKLHTVWKYTICVKFHTVSKTTHCVENYTLCVKLHIVCEITHCIQKCTVKSPFCNNCERKKFHSVNFFTLALLLMLRTNIRYGQEAHLLWIQMSSTAPYNIYKDDIDIKLKFREQDTVSFKWCQKKCRQFFVVKRDNSTIIWTFWISYM